MKMVSLCHPVRIRTCGKFATRNAAAKVLCSMETPPSQSTIKVVIIGATKEIGRTAIVAVSKARGMELAGAIDSQGIGEDAGQVLTVHSMCYFPCTALVSHVQSPSCCFSSLSRTLCECWHIALQISGMEEPLEIPVLNDLTMVLGSIAQSRATGVVVDFSEPSTVYDNVKQARGQVLGEDGVRVHSMVLPGLVSSTSINFSGPGEVL
ncbi:hypothetical protein PVAP13_9KG568200 [Panicum virgatum]|uniref:Dihydrodipicolinate reductase N-terminal domain-containing protein n=1 Tax=Panicum virgatum TaxID=38727 RepID=A0A8T0P9D5_PANVG|nr:hypothetical protein PVAP13_9KG568200 [Panicum virgatum]